MNVLRDALDGVHCHSRSTDAVISSANAKALVHGRIQERMRPDQFRNAGDRLVSRSKAFAASGRLRIIRFWHTGSTVSIGLRAVLLGFTQKCKSNRSLASARFLAACQRIPGTRASSGS